LGGPKGWGPRKKVANIEIYVIFEVFAFCDRRTKTDFKDRDPRGVTFIDLHFTSSQDVRLSHCQTKHVT